MLAGSTRSAHCGARPLVLALLLLTASVAPADDEAAKKGAEAESWLDQIDKWRFQTSLATAHANPRDDHNNQQNLINVELWLKNKWHGGVAVFDNSYGQSSQYVYLGKAWNILDSPYFYWRLTGGVIHGYSGEYKDKIPLNGTGIAPGIIPAVGAQLGPVFTEIQTGGISAIMWTVGVEIR